MNNRITALNVADAADYEEWADAAFELAFGYHANVCTLVYGDPHPEDAEDQDGEDFGIHQNAEQRKRLENLLKKRMN